MKIRICQCKQCKCVKNKRKNRKYKRFVKRLVNKKRRTLKEGQCFTFYWA